MKSWVSMVEHWWCMRHKVVYILTLLFSLTKGMKREWERELLSGMNLLHPNNADNTTLWIIKGFFPMLLGVNFFYLLLHILTTCVFVTSMLGKELRQSRIEQIGKSSLLLKQFGAESKFSSIIISQQRSWLFFPLAFSTIFYTDMSNLLVFCHFIYFQRSFGVYICSLVTQLWCTSHTYIISPLYLRVNHSY